MKVLLATNFLAPSVTARILLGSLRWRAGTQIEVLHVLRTRRSGLFGTVQSPSDETLSLAKGEVMAFANELRRSVAETGASVQGSTRVGDPADQILDRARQIEADLVVLGGRSGGELATSVGSVCAAVVDRASFPVLVARTSAIDSVLLADDGSAAADAAAEAVAQWSILNSLPVTVTSVIDDRTAVMVAAPQAELPGAFDMAAGSAREMAASVVERRVAEFTSSRGLVVGQVREGRASEEILEVARLRSVDLIVLGTSRRAGLARLLLGSVTRSVLMGFSGSVLVVRPRRTLLRATM